jgi:protein ImuB
VRTVGAALNLPTDAVARRFDPETAAYLDRLLGRSPDPRPAFELPKHYLGRCCLGAEVDNTQALLFPIRRLLSEFQGYLRAIDAGIQQLSLLFEHHKRASTRIEIGASTPTRDAERLFALTRERLENFSLPAPVQEVHLQADRFTPAAAAQNDFFKGAATHEEHLHQVLEKITARLGPEAVRTVSLVADHRPELAWKYASGSELSHSGASAGIAANLPRLAAPRPLWLLPEPCRIDAPDNAGDSPERIESRWSQDPPIARDYYIASAHDGAQLWVYRDGTSGQWYLHGLWS